MKCLVVLLITWGLAMSFPFENGKESQDEVPSNPPPKMDVIGPPLVNNFNIGKNQKIEGHHNVGQRGNFGPGGNQGGNGGNFNINGDQEIGGHDNVGQQRNFRPGGNQGGNGGNFNIKGDQTIGGHGNVGQQGNFGQGGNQGGVNPPVMPTVPGNNNIGQTKQNAGKSCKEIKGKRPNAGSGVYWIKPDGINPIQAYCDQQTDAGGWTLVFSYTFTNYGAFISGRNAIIPRPNWPIDYDSGNINPSTTPPQSETDYNATNFNLWKNLGHEFMVKSNINHWIACKEGSGSLVEFRVGSLQCRLIKNVVSKCQNYVPDELILHVAEHQRGKTLGPGLIRSQSWTWLKEYYYFEANTRTINWPTHDPCGEHSPNHLKYVANPHGNIYIRE